MLDRYVCKSDDVLALAGTYAVQHDCKSDDVLALAGTYAVQHDSVYLKCSEKLTDSQLSLPHGMNKKCKRKN